MNFVTNIIFIVFSKNKQIVTFTWFLISSAIGSTYTFQWNPIWQLQSWGFALNQSVNKNKKWLGSLILLWWKPILFSWMVEAEDYSPYFGYTIHIINTSNTHKHIQFWTICFKGDLKQKLLWFLDGLTLASQLIINIYFV